METTLSRLTDVFRDVFDDDTIVLSSDTTADDIEEWDSLMHVTLLVNVEKAFGIKFSSAQVALLTNVAELVELIDSLLGAKAPANAPRAVSAPAPER